MGLDKETLSKILSVPTLGIRFVKSKKGSIKFLKLCGALDGLLTINSDKRALKEEFQLLLELIKCALLPRYNKETTLIGVDLLLMEILLKYKRVNLIAIIIEHINTIINVKDGRHGIPYGLWINRVFSSFNIECGKVKANSVKGMFVISTREKSDYILG